MASDTILDDDRVRSVRDFSVHDLVAGIRLLVSLPAIRNENAVVVERKESPIEERESGRQTDRC